MGEVTLHQAVVEFKPGIVRYGWIVIPYSAWLLEVQTKVYEICCSM